MNLKRELQNQLNYKNFREILTIAQIESKIPLLTCSTNLRQSKETTCRYKKQSEYKDVLAKIEYKDKDINTIFCIDEMIFDKSLTAPEKFLLILLGMVKRIKIDNIVDKYKLNKRLLIKTLKVSKLFCLNNSILTIDKEELRIFKEARSQPVLLTADKKNKVVNEFIEDIKNNLDTFTNEDIKTIYQSLLKYIDIKSISNNLDKEPIELKKQIKREIFKEIDFDKKSNNFDKYNFDEFSWDEIDKINNINFGIN